jgi:hypothetical protein
MYEAAAPALIQVKHKSDIGRCQKRVGYCLRRLRTGGDKTSPFDPAINRKIELYVT